MWKIIDEKNFIYLIQWNLESEIKKGDFDPHTRIIRNDEQLQELMNELSINEEVINLSIWKRQDIDYEG